MAGKITAVRLFGPDDWRKLDLARYDIPRVQNPVSGDEAFREDFPHQFSAWVREWPEAAAACPSVLDHAPRVDGFLTRRVLL